MLAQSKTALKQTEPRVQLYEVWLPYAWLAGSQDTFRPAALANRASPELRTSQLQSSLQPCASSPPTLS